MKTYSLTNRVSLEARLAAKSVDLPQIPSYVKHHRVVVWHCPASNETVTPYNFQLLAIMPNSSTVDLFENGPMSADLKKVTAGEKPLLFWRQLGHIVNPDTGGKSLARYLVPVEKGITAWEALCMLAENRGLSCSIRQGKSGRSYDL